MAEREILRCPHCQLNQFVSPDRACRRCKRALDKPTPIEPTPEPIHMLLSIQIRKSTDTLCHAVAQTIQEERSKRGWSQRQMALKMESPRTYISKIENGKATPNLHSLFRFCECLQVSPGDFMARVEGIRLLCAAADAALADSNIRTANLRPA